MSSARRRADVRAVLIVGLLSLIALATTAAAGGRDVPSGSRAQSLDTVNLLVAYAAPDPGSAWWEAGIKAGIWQKYGIDLHIHYLSGAASIVSSLEAGQVDVTFSGAEQNPVVDATGGDLVEIAQLSYSSPYSWGFLANSPIQSPKQLSGKRLGVISATTSVIPLLDAELATYGISPHDVTLVPIGDGTAAVSAVSSGKVDALFYFDSGYVRLQQAGIKLKIVPLGPKFHGAYPANIVSTTRAELSSKPDVLTKFVHALQAAVSWCEGNPETCLNDLNSYAPGSIADTNQALAILKKRATIMQLPPEAHGQIGFSSAKYWNNLVGVLTSAGVLAHAPNALLYTNRFALARLEKVKSTAANNTAKKIAQWKLGSPKKWSVIYNDNLALYAKLKVTAEKAATQAIPPGTVVYYNNP